MKHLNHLVVDGFLNSRNGVARVRLTRSLPLDSEISYPPESGALVSVESHDGVRFQLPEVTHGTYETTRDDLHNGSKYRLFITTFDGVSYESDFVLLRPSPTLEDLSWVRDGDGITIQVDASGTAESTRYYQWSYTETWEYDADRQANFIVKGGRPIRRTEDEKIHICYSTQHSTRVFVSTTGDQSGDVINDFELVHIPGGSKKLCRTYSILVQQRSLDEAAFNYWSQLQKTTENLGGLFDPMPTTLFGNVHSTEPNGPVVLGYFHGSGVEEKRIYIRFRDLPEDVRFVNRTWCSEEMVNAAIYQDGTPMLSEITIAFPVDRSAPGFICMDCRLEGGTLTKPSFWPN